MAEKRVTSARKRARPAQAQERALDAALENTFPASDPPSQTDPSRGIKRREESAVDQRPSSRIAASRPASVKGNIRPLSNSPTRPIEGE